VGGRPFLNVPRTYWFLPRTFSSSPSMLLRWARGFTRRAEDSAPLDQGGNPRGDVAAITQRRITDRARDFPAFLGELPILFYGPVLLEPGAHRHDDARMAVLFLPESGSGHRPPRAFPHMTTAIPGRAVSGRLFLIGQAVPFLSHLE
jgi:hypothetical protein